jgi:hypothetical protein
VAVVCRKVARKRANESLIVHAKHCVRRCLLYAQETCSHWLLPWRLIGPAEACLLIDVIRLTSDRATASSSTYAASMLCTRIHMSARCRKDPETDRCRECARKSARVRVGKQQEPHTLPLFLSQRRQNRRGRCHRPVANLNGLQCSHQRHVRPHAAQSPHFQSSCLRRMHPPTPCSSNEVHLLSVRKNSSQARAARERALVRSGTSCGGRSSWRSVLCQLPRPAGCAASLARRSCRPCGRSPRPAQTQPLTAQARRIARRVL